MRYAILLALSLVVGVWLRLSYPLAIEFKFDEAETLNYARQFADGKMDLPWVGQPSSNGLRHPGFGLWPFMLAANSFELESPEAITRVPQVFGILHLMALAALAYLGFRGRARIYLLLATCLLAVTPFWVLQDRKAWHPSLLGFFTTLFLIAWRFRHRRFAAFVAGALALLPGQIHMSGFFFLLGFIGLTCLGRLKAEWEKARVGYFLAGLSIGFAMMLPWLIAVVTEPNPYPFSLKWTRLVEFKYFNYWWSNGYSLLLKFPFGAATMDFLKGPAGAAVILLGALFLFHLPAHLKRLLRWRRIRFALFSPFAPELTRWEFAALFGTALVTIVSFMHVPRYFLLAAGVFPLVTLARAAKLARIKGSKRRRWLEHTFMLVWVAQLVFSVSALHFIAGRTATIPGDFGPPLHLSR